MYLLEPESDDGIVAWDVGRRSSAAPATVTVRRLATAIPVRLDAVR
jgi:hypothetical protein